jgi:hypothetical protein
MKTQKLNIKVRDLTPLLGKSRKTMIEGRNLMKNITLIMCFIAALAIFVLPVDAATRVKQSIPITLSVPVVCNVGEVVDLSGRLHAVITFRRLSFLSAHVDVKHTGGRGYWRNYWSYVSRKWDDSYYKLGVASPKWSGNPQHQSCVFGYRCARTRR